MIPPKKQTPEWTIPFNQSEPETGWNVTGLCSAQPSKEAKDVVGLICKLEGHLDSAQGSIY